MLAVQLQFAFDNEILFHEGIQWYDDEERH